MLQMLYVSGASAHMTDAGIKEILTASRRNNLRAGITGMLLWADGVFIQILEGEQEAVRALYRRIEQVADKRLFTEWSMGFKQLDAEKAEDKKLFQISRSALADRIAGDDGGMFLETVLAFSRDFIADLEQPLRAAHA
jgi:hypothetical protein